MAAEHLIGRTIADDITRLRLERAKRRIVETETPMKDVAIDAGFRNADHFYKVFTRIENIPPPNTAWKGSRHFRRRFETLNFKL